MIPETFAQLPSSLYQPHCGGDENMQTHEYRRKDLQKSQRFICDYQNPNTPFDLSPTRRKVEQTFYGALTVTTELSPLSGLITCKWKLFWLGS